MIAYPYYEIWKSTTDRPDEYRLAVDRKFSDRSKALTRARQVSREDYTLDVLVMEYYIDEQDSVIQTPIHL